MDWRIQVTATNDATLESESITLNEQGINSDIFFGIVKTAPGNVAGPLGDATLNTKEGDVIDISYLDDLTVQGGTATLIDDDEVVDPFGDADDNGAVQTFDAAKVLLHVLSSFLTGLDSLSANLDSVAFDAVFGKITPPHRHYGRRHSPGYMERPEPRRHPVGQRRVFLSPANRRNRPDAAHVVAQLIRPGR
jgi:hypothetical protein